MPLYDSNNVKRGNCKRIITIIIIISPNKYLNIDEEYIQKTV